METSCNRKFKKSESRKSVKPGGKSWKKRHIQKSACKAHLKRVIERKRALKK